MTQGTQRYKRTLNGSIGAGMKSLMGSSKKYYILEHKVSSKYHQVGESQEIIVDQIEIGRSSSCQVRYDESFSTVSRRHAAIVKDGENWKLVQLSATNSTFLNGRMLKNEWYLQNGDEIQLSINGPKLGFIIPTGKRATVGSIGLTHRMSLFRQQALKPYKTAIAMLAVLMILSVGGLGIWGRLISDEYEDLIMAQQEKINNLNEQNQQLQTLIANAAVEQARLDSLLKVKSRPIHKTVIVGGERNTQALQKFEDDIFHMSAAIYVEYNGRKIPLETKDGGYLGWSGTGYLLTDGRFVTAKHCVEGWKFDSAETLGKQLSILKDETYKNLFIAGLTNAKGIKLGTIILAKSPSKELKLQSSQFTFNRSDEKQIPIGENITVTHATGSGGTDWAYVNIGQSGGIMGDAVLSANLQAGARLEVLGYPRGLKTKSNSCMYGSCQTAGRGLDEGLILITGKNYEPGNSGGPVFYNDNGTYKAVGIVSFSIYDNMGGLTPLYNLR